MNSSASRSPITRLARTSGTTMFFVPARRRRCIRQLRSGTAVRPRARRRMRRNVPQSRAKVPGPCTTEGPQTANDADGTLSGRTTNPLPPGKERAAAGIRPLLVHTRQGRHGGPFLSAPSSHCARSPRQARNGRHPPRCARQGAKKSPRKAGAFGVRCGPCQSWPAAAAGAVGAGGDGGGSLAGTLSVIGRYTLNSCSSSATVAGSVVITSK